MRVGPFEIEILKSIGQGTIGEVFLARSQGPGGFERTVAVKRFWHAISSDRMAVARLERITEAATDVNHPNMVEIDGFSQSPEGFHLLVMEYVEGIALRQIIDTFTASKRLLPIALTLEIGRQVCMGLHRFSLMEDANGNRLNLPHRGIRPRNLQLTPSGHVKIMDPGLVGHPDLSLAMDERGRLDSTLSYASPELAQGEPCDITSDQYAVALIMVELLIGKPVYEASSLQGMKADVETGNTRDALARVEYHYPAIFPLLSRALNRDPEQRFPDSGAMAMALEKLTQRASMKLDVGRLVRLLRKGEPVPERWGLVAPWDAKKPPEVDEESEALEDDDEEEYESLITLSGRRGVTVEAFESTDDASMPPDPMALDDDSAESELPEPGALSPGHTPAGGDPSALPPDEAPDWENIKTVQTRAVKPLPPTANLGGEGEAAADPYGVAPAAPAPSDPYGVAPASPSEPVDPYGVAPAAKSAPADPYGVAPAAPADPYGGAPTAQSPAPADPYGVASVDEQDPYGIAASAGAPSPGAGQEFGVASLSPGVPKPPPYGLAHPEADESDLPESGLSGNLPFSAGGLADGIDEHDPYGIGDTSSESLDPAADLPFANDSHQDGPADPYGLAPSKGNPPPAAQAASPGVATMPFDVEEAPTTIARAPQAIGSSPDTDPDETPTVVAPMPQAGAVMDPFAGPPRSSAMGGKSPKKLTTRTERQAVLDEMALGDELEEASLDDDILEGEDDLESAFFAPKTPAASGLLLPEEEAPRRSGAVFFMAALLLLGLGAAGAYQMGVLDGLLPPAGQNANAGGDPAAPEAAVAQGEKPGARAETHSGQSKTEPAKDGAALAGQGLASHTSTKPAPPKRADANNQAEQKEAATQSTGEKAAPAQNKGGPVPTQMARQGANSEPTAAKSTAPIAVASAAPSTRAKGESQNAAPTQKSSPKSENNPSAAKKAPSSAQPTAVRTLGSASPESVARVAPPEISKDDAPTGRVAQISPGLPPPASAEPDSVVKTGTLQFRSWPAASEVIYENGVVANQARSRTTLPAGRHLLTIRTKDGQSATVPVTIIANHHHLYYYNFANQTLSDKSRDGETYKVVQNPTE